MRARDIVRRRGQSVDSRRLGFSRARRLLLEPLESRLLLALDHAGTIAADETWTAAEVHRITNDVTVAEGVTLTVEAGTMVQFDATPDLIVQGTLSAVGTAGSSILFTSVLDDTGFDGLPGTGDDVDTTGNGPSTGVRGAWSMIEFADTSTASVMDHVEVRFGGRGDLKQVSVQGGQFTLTNSTLRESQGDGIRINNSSPTLTNNAFRDNTGSAISMDLASNPAITGVTVENNDVNGLSLDSGTLVGNGFWDDPDVVYRMSDSVTVPEGATLTVGQGQVVKVAAGAADLIVEGTLLADGTTDAPIVFTTHKDDTAGGDTNNNADANSPFRGDWNGIHARGGTIWITPCWLSEEAKRAIGARRPRHSPRKIQA